MNRRTFLRSAAVLAGSVPLAGCTEETLVEAESRPPPIEERYDEDQVNLPIEEGIEVAAAEIERTADAEVEGVEGFEALLTDRDLALEALEEVEVEGEPALSLEYVDEETAERGTLYGLGVVAGGYAALVRAEHDVEELEATLLDQEGDPFGHYTVKTADAEEYNEGAISAKEYARHVVDELEAE